MKNPIWLLPGFLGDDSQLGDFPEALAQHTGVVPDVIDWCRITEGARDLSEGGSFLAQFALSSGMRPVLVGYSMGARLALASLVAAPGAFSGAVAVSAHPGLEDATARAERRAADDEWSALLVSDQAEFWRRWLAQPVFAGTAEIGRALTALEAQQWSQVLRAFSTAGQDFFPPLLADPRLPPLVSVVGERDAKYVALQQLYPSTVDKLMLPGGHRVPLDAPAELARAIAPFIRKTQEIL